MAEMTNGKMDKEAFAENKYTIESSRKYLSFSIEEILRQKPLSNNRVSPQKTNLPKQENSSEERDNTAEEKYPPLSCTNKNASSEAPIFQWLRCTRYNPPKVQSK